MRQGELLGPQVSAVSLDQNRRPILPHTRRQQNFGRGTLGDLRGRPVTPRTARSAYFPVQAAFAYAARHKVIRYNPASDVELPGANTDVTGHFLSRAEVAALTGEVAKTEPVDALLLRFAAGLGLRASGQTGLRIRDVRLAARQVDVFRTVKKAHPTGWTVDVPKSKRSTRTVRSSTTTCSRT